MERKWDDYAFENWVKMNYVFTNPRFKAIEKRMNGCPPGSSDALFVRYKNMKEGLLKIYTNDKQIKKQYKTHLAIEKMLGV
jgi:hypothetical protein